jgi:hypothetical protein
VARTACITFSTVFGRTICGVFSALLTVIGDNPAVRATSSSVGARGGLEFFTVDAFVKIADGFVHYSS